MSEIKEKHPSWFKMKIERRELIRQLSPETAVNVLLACWDFLETGERPPGLSPIESVAFASFIPDMEEAWNRYMQRIEARNSGKGKSNDIDRNRSISSETEEEPETDSLLLRNKDRGRGADKPPAPTRRKYGQYGWVKLTDSDYNRLLDDFGQAEVERCIAYVDESAQSTGNKNRWKDWNLVLRRCHRDSWGLTSTRGGGEAHELPDL